MKDPLSITHTIFELPDGTRFGLRGKIERVLLLLIGRPEGAKQSNDFNNIKWLTGTLSLSRTLAAQLILANLFRPQDWQNKTPATAATETGAIISLAANDKNKTTRHREAVQ